MKQVKFEDLWFYLPQSALRTAVLAFVFLTFMVLLRNENRKRIDNGEQRSNLIFLAYAGYFFLNGVMFQLIYVKLLLFCSVIALAIILTGRKIRTAILAALLYSMFVGFYFHHAREASLRYFTERVVRNMVFGNNKE